jgi:hypothetical protein
MIEQSQNWCCELCGCMIKGLCNNDDGYITHIDSCCLSEEDKDYCNNCEEHIEQIDLGDGVFGCPICKRADCIEIEEYEDDEDNEDNEEDETERDILNTNSQIASAYWSGRF